MRVTMSSAVKGRAKAGSHRLPDGEYEAMLAMQGGHCALCPNTPKTRRLHVDRDHSTGEVRGLLCMRCNRNLPSWVTGEWCRRASLYVEPRVAVLTARTCPECGAMVDVFGKCDCHRWPGES